MASVPTQASLPVKFNPLNHFAFQNESLERKLRGYFEWNGVGV